MPCLVFESLLRSRGRCHGPSNGPVSVTWCTGLIPTWKAKGSRSAEKGLWLEILEPEDMMAVFWGTCSGMVQEEGSRTRRAGL